MKTSLLSFLLLALLVLSVLGCATPPPAPAQPPLPQQVTVVVSATVLVPGPTVIATHIVEVTPEPPEIILDRTDTSTLVIARSGDPGTLDPALAYDIYSYHVINQIYETLVIAEGANPNVFVPQLATEMPTISDDGLTYTFTIRDGITFHEGGTLTAEDVAYTFQRGLLQGGYSSPQLLLTEPLLGVGVYDVSEVLFAEDPEAGDKVGNPTAVQAADPAQLVQVCELVKSKIVADGNRVTFNLANAWAPFIPTLVGNWGAIMDKEWVIENGGWDGDCGTWQSHYGHEPESNPFHEIMNGTGPYQLEHWLRDDEVILSANENYWRTEATGPVWEGGPVGAPAIKTIVFKVIPEWGNQYAQMLAGDLDFAEVPSTNYVQMDGFTGEICDYSLDTFTFTCAPSARPDAPVRMFRGMPGTSRGDVLFNWSINPDPENYLIGSGQLDGNGIPPDFFTDVHVRRGFNYCFDWDTYIQDVYEGDAVQNVGVTLPGMLGYNPEGSKYTFDLDKCAEELALAWNGQLPETGFRLQFMYQTPFQEVEIIGSILQANLATVNEKYVVEVVGTTLPGYIDLRERNYLPVMVGGWAEDYHDPHNWAQPWLAGFFANRAKYPDALKAQLREMVTGAVVETDPAERQRLYEAINEFDYENALALRLVVPLSRFYWQRWVQFEHPVPYFYAFSKE